MEIHFAAIILSHYYCKWFHKKHITRIGNYYSECAKCDRYFYEFAKQKQELEDIKFQLEKQQMRDLAQQGDFAIEFGKSKLK